MCIRDRVYSLLLAFASINLKADQTIGGTALNLSLIHIFRYGYGFVQGADAAAAELGQNIEINYFYGGQFYGCLLYTSTPRWRAESGWNARRMEITGRLLRRKARCRRI